MRYTVTPPIDDNNDEQYNYDHHEMNDDDGDYWSRMNPRDDNVPLGCHLNLDEEEEDEYDEYSSFDRLPAPHKLLVGANADARSSGANSSSSDDSSDDDRTALAGTVTSTTQATCTTRSDSGATAPPRTPILASTAVAGGGHAAPIPIKHSSLASSGLKRSLSDDQLLVAGRRAAERRDHIMFQRLVNGISRQQAETVWEHPRLVNSECLAHIISAHQLADDDDDDDLMDAATTDERATYYAPQVVHHRQQQLFPPTAAARTVPPPAPPAVVMPIPVVVRPMIQHVPVALPVGGGTARRASAHAASNLHSGMVGASGAHHHHLGPKVIPTLIRPLTLVTVASASSDARTATSSSTAVAASLGPHDPVKKVASPSSSSRREAASTMTMDDDDAIFDLDM